MLLDMGMWKPNGNDFIANMKSLQKWLQGLTDGINECLCNIEVGNLNDATLTNITAPINAKIEDADNNIAYLELTAEGLSVLVESLNSRNTVTIDAEGMYITDADGNTTTFTGDYIKSGTIEGVTLISQNGYGPYIQIANGYLSIGGSHQGEAGSLGFDYGTNKLFLESSPGFVLKIVSQDNMSIDAASGCTIYIGTSNIGTDITIGNSGGALHLVGSEITANGVPL